MADSNQNVFVLYFYIHNLCRPLCEWQFRRYVIGTILDASVLNQGVFSHLHQRLILVRRLSSYMAFSTSVANFEVQQLVKFLCQNGINTLSGTYYKGTSIESVTVPSTAKHLFNNYPFYFVNEINCIIDLITAYEMINRKMKPYLTYQKNASSVEHEKCRL